MLVEPETILTKSNHGSAPHLGGTRSTACRRLAADEQRPVRLHLNSPLTERFTNLKTSPGKRANPLTRPQSSRSSNA